MKQPTSSSKPAKGYNAKCSFEVKGHVKIHDDLGNVLLDKDNAIHPQNIARIIARALANESNHSIYKIALGNGGTAVNAAYTITYNPPHDGQSPDVKTWDSGLYNETYAEVIDEGNPTLNPLLGTNPDGGGANPTGDPASVPNVSGPGVRSNELGLSSEVVIVAVLNPGEPAGQFNTDTVTPTSTESSFMFDELGLYTYGAPSVDTNGYQYIDVGNRVSTDDTTLLPSTGYSFNVAINGGSPQLVSFTTPATGSGTAGEILYGDLCEAINTQDPAWGSPTIVGATISITDVSNSFPSIAGAQTYGYLKVASNATGITSSITITDVSMIAALNSPTGGNIQAAVQGVNAGVQNDPVNPTLERQRLLTHLIFSPVLKASNRTLTITYTLTISVARSA
jgi:hypothetical protein